jgi:hypothetical protein
MIRSLSRAASAASGFVLPLVLAGCSNDYAQEPEKVQPTQPAPKHAEESPADVHSEVNLKAEPGEIVSVPGQPRFTDITSFGRPEGVPTYLAHLLGTKEHVFQNVVVKNDADHHVTAVLRGSLQGYTRQEALVTLELDPGQTEQGWFDVSLDLDAIAKISAPITASYSLSLTVDGNIVSAWTKPVTVLPRNTVFWAPPGINGVTEPMLALTTSALTTPHDRWQEIDKLLQLAAKKSVSGSMSGYQAQQPGMTVDQQIEIAKGQARPLYAALQSRGFVYTNVAADFFDGAQNVRYPAESLRASTGNCIDASLVFASALESIGMRAAVIFVPGHAFAGFYAGPAGTVGGDRLFPVEMTVLDTTSFDDAVVLGVDEWDATPAESRFVISLEAQRKLGFSPSPFPM